MKKKHAAAIILLFIFLTLLEIGIFIEVVWHGWGGFGDISLEYTEIGIIGTDFLVFFVPVILIIIFLVRLTLCIKKIKNIKNMKALLFDCFYALLGICIAIGILFIVPIKFKDSIPVYNFGRQMTAFIIDYFSWMTYPIP